MELAGFQPSTPVDRAQRLLRLMLRGAIVLVGCGAATSVRAAPPPFAEVAAAAKDHFATLKDYKRGDLITQRDVDPLLKRLHGMGFDVRAKEEGVQVLLAEQDPLVRLLRTGKGKEFMRALSAYPQALDRMARLAKFAEGRALVTKLVGNHDLKGVAELCSFEGARRLEAAFFNQLCMRNFDVESGFAYTEEQYLSHLRTMHLLAEKNLSRPGD